MTERINAKKLRRNVAEVKELLEVNRDIMGLDEYLTSKVALAAVDIAIENSKEPSLWEKIKQRRHGRG